MIKVTADIFSGLPNPEWIVPASETQNVLRSLTQRPGITADVHAGFQGLGNRGLVVELLEDHASSEHGLPSRFRISGQAGENGSYAHEAAERLINTMKSATPSDKAAAPHVAAGTHAAAEVPLTDELMKYVLQTLPKPGSGLQTQTSELAPATAAAPDASLLPPISPCAYESSAFNPGFWNDPAHISKNNCYNYATNRRTDTFAQPGRASGHMYQHINCAEVGNGAVSDGATFSCAPDSQKPRWWMALVIAPGPGFVDFHWYRKATEPFWGHKPGSTAARNVDNAGHIVIDPRTANRGPYTIFCGFLYAQAKMIVR